MREDLQRPELPLQQLGTSPAPAEPVKHESFKQSLSFLLTSFCQKRSSFLCSCPVAPSRQAGPKVAEIEKKMGDLSVRDRTQARARHLAPCGFGASELLGKQDLLASLSVAHVANGNVDWYHAFLDMVEQKVNTAFQNRVERERV